MKQTKEIFKILFQNKRNFVVEWLTVHHKFYKATMIYQIYEY